MTYTIIISPLAQRDIADAADYIAYEKGAPETAERIRDGLLATIEDLVPFPRKFQLDEDPLLSAAGLHKCIYKNYLIYYLINERTREVQVARVLHELTDARPHLIP